MMTEYRVGTLHGKGGDKNEGDTRGPHVARATSWERRLSEARERRQEVIAARESLQKGTATKASTGAVRDLASVLRGDPADMTERERVLATLTSGGASITPDRLAEARRLRDEVLAERASKADSSNQTDATGFVPVSPGPSAGPSDADTPRQPPQPFEYSDTVVPLRPRKKRRSRLLFWALIASLGLGAYALYQSRPEVARSAFSSVTNAIVAPASSTPTAPSPSLMDQSPVALGQATPQVEALAIGSLPPFWAPNARRAVLPLLVVSGQPTPGKADSAPPLPLDPAQASLFDMLDARAFTTASEQHTD